MLSIIVATLPYVQVLLSILLIGSILLQQTGSGLGAFGGGADTDAIHYTRRGFEKTLFQFTIVLAVLFVASAIAALVL